MKLVANEVCIEDEYESQIQFIWPDPCYGWECFTVERSWVYIFPPSITVSRRMPFYSGRAGIERLELHNDRIEVWLSDELAKKINLPSKIDIGFCVTGEVMERMRTTFARIFEDCSVFLDRSNASGAR